MTLASRFSFLVALGAVSSFAVAPSGAAVAADKPTIVLVHGAFENAAVWKDVQAQLQKDGYRTVAVDLPGRDGDPTPKAQITLDTLRDAVLAKLHDESTPVVLVGHSFGGITISAVGEAAPEKIRRLVYVAAYLPRDGESLQSLSQQDTGSKMGPSFKVDPQRMVASVDYDKRAELFLNDATPAQRQGFADTMVDEPLQPPGTPIKLSADRFGKVKKTYIKTARDVVVSPVLQDAMLKNTPVESVLTLDTGHAPFLTQPVALAKAIETSAR